MPPSRAAQQVYEAMRVAGNEIHRSLAEALALHQGFNRLPPATRCLDVADLATTQHADAEILFLGLDAAQRGEQVAPDLDQSQRIVFGDTHALQDLELLLRAVHAAEVFCAEESVKLVPFDLERHQLRN